MDIKKFFITTISIKLVLILFCMILLIGSVSAWDFDNRLYYENNDMKVYVENAFGLGETLGSVELKSHRTVNEVLKVGFGKEEVVMYYDFEGWDLYENGLGNVEFIDQRTSKKIIKDYYFVEWKEVEVEKNDYVNYCEKDYINGTKGVCGRTVNGTHKEMKYMWVKYDSKNIPNRNARIGLKTYVGSEDYIDAKWTIAGKKINKHASWTASLNANIISYWRFDEGNSTPLDSAGTHDCSASAPTNVTGKLGSAYHFDGTDDTINCGHSGEFEFGENDFSVSLWLYPTLINANRQFIGYTDNTSVGFGYTHQSVGELTLYIAHPSAWGTALDTGLRFTNGTWQHVVIVRDGLVVTAYMNTTMGTNATDVDWINPMTVATWNIGSYGNGAFWGGKIDEVGLWNRSLSTAEVIQLYNNGNGMTYDANPVTPPIVTLIAPANETTKNTPTVSFNCSVYDNVAVGNVSLILDGVINETNTTGVNNSVYTFVKVLSEGSHYWSCRAWDDEDTQTTASLWEVNISFVPPTITLHYPTNLTNSTTSSIHFNATVFDDMAITNVSLIIDDVVNETNATGLNNSVYGFDKILADGYHTWTMRAFDNYGNVTTAGGYNLSIDTLDPVVSASNITDLVTTSLPVNSTWGYTASDSNLNLCYYNTSENASYIFITCNSSITNTEWTSGGNKTVQFCANDSFARETCNTEYIWVYSITETQSDNPDPIGEGATATFNFTVNLTDIPTTTATLMINNTIYTPTTSTAGVNGYYFVKNLVIPDTWGNTTGNELNWSWNYTITGVSTNASTTMTNITVYEMAVDNCTLYDQVILNLSLRDEEANSVIDPLVDNTTVEVEINLTSIIDPSINIEYSYTFSNYTNPQLCVPLNLINNTNYTADITVGFESTSRVWEFWHLDNGTVDLAGNFNSYTSRNINLMDLITADSTSFLFNYYNLNGQAVDGSIAHIYRKYIGEGLFREVERSKADENGDTIVHLVEEDVIYYFMITLDGVILYTSSIYTALCQAVPCTINIQEGGESAVFETDWDLVEGGGYSINSSRSSRQVSLVYVLDESATMNFTLYKYESDGTYAEVNSSQNTGTSGIITLNIPQSAGNVSFFATVVKDDVFINSEWVDFSGQAIDWFGTVLSIFLGAMLILTLGLMAISTGAGVLIWVMVGIFISGALGLFATALSTGVSIVIYLIVAGALLLWKITGGRK